MAETQAQETQYPIKIEAKNGVFYSQAATAVIKLSLSYKLMGGKTYYFLDDGKAQVIRTDALMKTMELSDKIDSETRKEIESIMTRGEGVLVR